MQTMRLGAQQALAGTPLPSRRPFTASRPARVAVRAQQNNDAVTKIIGAAAAAQILLLPFSGAAGALDMPLAAVSNPAVEFANRSKSAVNQAKGAVAPDPIQTLQAKTKAAADNTKATLAKGGVAPDPLKTLKNASDKAANKAGGAVKNASNKAKAANPAREFALKAEQAKKKVKSSPLLVIDPTGLQHEVLFGFGKKTDQAAGQAKEAAGDAKQAAGEVADEAKAKAKEAPSNAPEAFSIFDTKSVEDARQKLKANVDKAVNTKDDPAEKVVPETEPGESQEDNAERIRREAENGPTAGGDARAPTN